jgi:hypothetical protein
MPKYQMMYVHQEFMHSSGVLCTRLLLKKVPILNWAVRIPLPQPQRLVRLSSLNVEAHASATNESTAYATKESSSGVSGSTVGYDRYEPLLRVRTDGRDGCEETNSNSNKQHHRSYKAPRSTTKQLTHNRINHMHSILHITKQRTAPIAEKTKKVKVSFLNLNEAEEDDRQQRGGQLRARLKEEKASYKRFKKDVAHNNNPRRVYAALMDPANLVGLNGLAVHSRSFRTTLYSFFGDVAGMPNTNINQQQANALGVLNALIAANVAFPNIAGSPDAIESLHMIGALPAFQNFLNPLVSGGSDHDDDDDDKKRKASDKMTQTNNDKKNDDDDDSNGGGNKRLRA